MRAFLANRAWKEGSCETMTGARRIRLRIRKWRTSRLWAPFAVGVMLGASALLVQLIAADLRQQPGAGTMRSAQQKQEEGAAFERAAEGRDAAAGGVRERPGNPPPEEGSGAAKGGAADELGDVVVRVYITGENRVERVPLETYVRGVVAGEMPPDFELEALKAQAIAARTYIVRRLELRDRSGMPVRNADVTDTPVHQVYVPLKKLGQTMDKESREKYMAVLDKATEETKGEIVTFRGEPIEAVFFSTSNGYTENSEDYWQEEIPYLRSVPSPWDVDLSPDYKETVTMTLKEFYGKLGISSGREPGKPSIKVLERTDGKRIAEIRIEGRTYSGREVREKLGLASSQFTWKVEGDSIAITTYGYGHGIGMSQWGANGMAKEGRNALDILAYYYTGAEVVQASKLANLSEDRRL
ncbi:stage II sporulation protein D [Paenibacillus thailandensis]|uniref:Stage II sporulation protein D n=1 Tax=Paenibacillus thailandensis TaxID=393250 RepID=A0ABW5R3K5_9BACL